MSKLTTEELGVLRVKLGRGYPKRIQKHLADQGLHVVREQVIRRGLSYNYQNPKYVNIALLLVGNDERAKENAKVGEVLSDIQKDAAAND